MSNRTQKIALLMKKTHRDSYLAKELGSLLPDQIRALRERRGWSEAELADRARLSELGLRALQTPGADHFTVETLRRLAAAFDVALSIRFVTFGEFVDWSDRFNPDQFRVPGFDEEIAIYASTLARGGPEGVPLGARGQTADRYSDSRTITGQHPVYTGGAPVVESRKVVQSAAANTAVLGSRSSGAPKLAAAMFCPFPNDPAKSTLEAYTAAIGSLKPRTGLAPGLTPTRGRASTGTHLIRHRQSTGAQKNV